MNRFCHDLIGQCIIMPSIVNSMQSTSDQWPKPVTLKHFVTDRHQSRTTITCLGPLCYRGNLNLGIFWIPLPKALNHHCTINMSLHTQVTVLFYFFQTRSLRSRELSYPKYMHSVATNIAKFHKLDMPLTKEPRFLKRLIARWVGVLVGRY